MFIFTIRVVMKEIKNKILLGFVLLVVVVYCLIEAQDEGDFYIYMVAGGNLNGVDNIYEKSYSGQFNYFYSVLFAGFLKLFYTLPFYWVKFCWLLLNLFLYFKMFKLMSDSDLLNQISLRQKNLFLILVFIFSLRFLLDNIHSSQISIVILACCVYGILFIRNDKIITGSIILALGINIKLLPVVFLPYLFYKGYFKAFGLTVLFYILSLFLPSLIFGHAYNVDLLKSWASLVNPFQQRHVLDVEERSFHSLTTLLSTLFVENVPDQYALDLKRNIADVPLDLLAKIVLTIRLFFVGLTLYFMRWKPFVKGSQLELLTEVSYLLLLIPLIFPHQQHYAFLFMVPAFALTLYTLLLNYETFSALKKRILLVLLFLIYISSNLKLLFGEYNYYYEHFKILTYAALLLIPMLVWVLIENKRAFTSSLK